MFQIIVKNVDKSKNLKCTNPDYDYEDDPIKFYAKLVELNKMRKRKKRGE